MKEIKDIITEMALIILASFAGGLALAMAMLPIMLLIKFLG